MRPGLSSSALVPLALLLTTACGRGSALRGRIAELKQLTDEAARSGAQECAPRQLAMASAQLRFAELELDQGFASKAADHLSIAELNARAAQNLSPPGGCAREPVLADRDGDGIADAVDRCPDQPENYDGFEDQDGCPDRVDTDGDGIFDDSDACVLLAEDFDGYQDEDGCPDPDNDGDGVPDTVDRCPLEAEDPDGYQDADGCPDPDNDGDGVPDLLDQCPNIPGQTTQEPVGCPLGPTRTQLLLPHPTQARLTAAQAA